jgi:hypothetical protein
MQSLFGSGAKTQKLDTMTPEGQAFLKNLFGSIDPSMLEAMNDPLYAAGMRHILSMYDTEALEAPIRNEFFQSILPQISNQFGGRQGSSFNNAMGDAAARMMDMLGATRWQAQNQAAQIGGQYTQQALNSRQQAASTALGAKPFGYMQTGAMPGVLDALAGGFGKGAGSAMGKGVSNMFSEGLKSGVKGFGNWLLG